MGLSDDQRAMLRMVAQRGEQGYEDIAALMGLSVDEVRAKVAAALAELDSEGALADEGGEPAAEAPAAEEPPAAKQEPPPTQGPVAAKPPPPPSSPPPAAKAPSQPRKPRSGPPQIKLPSGPGLRAAIGAAVAVIALVAVIVIVTGGGEESGSATAAGETTAATETASSSETASKGEGEGEGGEANQLTKAKLTAVDGSEAEGVAIFGKVKKSLALEIAAQNLQPTKQGEAYTIWLSKNEKKMLPLASTPAKKGRIAAKFEIPVEVLGFLADETFTDLVLTRTENSRLTASLKTAAKAKATPEYTGTEVLRGEVTGPIVGAQFRLEELEELEEEEKAAEKGE